MGSAVGRALRQGGAAVATTLEGRSERTAELAEGAGLDLLPDLDSVVAAVDVVLSIAPPDRAESVADAVAAACARAEASPLVADLNAISPATARRIEAALLSA